MASLAHEEGLRETAVKGVQLFRMTEPVRCAPAIYEPAVVVIVSGAKEAILDGERHVYDSRQYLCCPISMPVEAGAPTASPETPLLGVYLSLDTRVMTELAIEMESAAGLVRKPARCRRGLPWRIGTPPSAMPCCDCCRWHRAPPMRRYWEKGGCGSFTTPS